MARRKTSEPANPDAAAARQPGTADIAAATQTSPAAPLEPPRRLPPEPHTPTAVAPNAAAPSPVEGAAPRLVDENGREVTVDEIFTYPERGRPGTMVTVNRRVYQDVPYPGTRVMGRRLLYPAGAQVSVWEAERVRAEYGRARAAAAAG